MQNELINGRTPEEIKRGLRCETAGEHCSTCTYQFECLSEDGDLGVLNRDALALIERLESERDAVSVVHGHIVWKDRRRGGVRKVTGRDEFGVEHTVRYMESYVERTPYCSVCTKVLGDALTYCPNCGAKMDAKED